MDKKRRPPRTPSRRERGQLASLLGLEPERLGEVTSATLRRCRRERLLSVARLLGVTRVSRLRLDELAATLEGPLRARAGSREVDAKELALRAKFELGRPVEPPAAKFVPWGYSQDRISAMAVDPDRLFLYWELRDESIAALRARLGKGGAHAWLNLRAYEVTDRIFDGTNAHRYVDIKIERGDRQWFTHIGQPHSSWCVEIGMKSHEGYFQSAARSARVDFPRREPAAPGVVEWMTVRVQTGETAGSFPAGPPLASPPTLAAPVAAPSLARPPARDGYEAHETPSHPGTARLPAAPERHALGHWEWTERRDGLQWAGPVSRWTFEAGPFSLPFEAPAYSEERWHYEGPVGIETLEAGTRITYGPWRVVIRGLEAHAERRVLATWELETSWVTAASRERILGGDAGAPGRAEDASSFAAASERLFMRASELRLRGASERLRLGASERSLGGASELVHRGASEWRYRGASERIFPGASEVSVGGASETLRAGASEHFFPGASDRRPPWTPA